MGMLNSCPVHRLDALSSGSGDYEGHWFELRGRSLWFAGCSALASGVWWGCSNPCPVHAWAPCVRALRGIEVWNSRCMTVNQKAQRWGFERYTASHSLAIVE